MTIAAQLKGATLSSLHALFPEAEIREEMITVNLTKPEFSGDYTVVLFPFVKLLRKKPDELGQALGEHLVANAGFFTAFQIVSGFLNLTVADSFWTSFLLNHFNDADFGTAPAVDRRVMVEYSSPNTNKPLHFGHLRNIFLGDAMSALLKATGNQVVKANLVNDRGIHICKSMIAWMRYGNGETPQGQGVKGDHFVGDYYVRFNDAYKEEQQALAGEGMDPAKAEREAPIMKEAQELLRKWEAGDKEVYGLWEKMNGWVYEGFEHTYERMGIRFDKMYYESDTYLLGKQLVLKGLEQGALYRKEDSSVWIDLEPDGLDQKLLLRGDGTSVYMTQDLGTAVLKYDDFRLDQSIYVIADEQNYHMKVLQLILARLGEPCAPGIHHLSYGMVELPSGRMKSREGTVVDADDMIDEMVRLAAEQTEQAGKTEGFSEAGLKDLYNMIGLGALKFYLLRVDPKKKMIFDPKESIDLHGFTATFIQYAHARICSILRKLGSPLLPPRSRFQSFTATEAWLPAERALALELEQYPEVLRQASAEYNPSLVCNYTFRLAQTFNSFYDQVHIANAESEEKKDLRTMLIVLTAQIIRHSMQLLGIRVPEKM